MIAGQEWKINFGMENAPGVPEPWHCVKVLRLKTFLGTVTCAPQPVRVPAAVTATIAMIVCPPFTSTVCVQLLSFGTLLLFRLARLRQSTREISILIICPSRNFERSHREGLGPSRKNVNFSMNPSSSQFICPVNKTEPSILSFDRFPFLRWTGQCNILRVHS